MRLDAKTGSSGGVNYNFDNIASPLGGITDKLKNFWSTFQTLLAPSVAAWSVAWDAGDAFPGQESPLV